LVPGGLVLVMDGVALQVVVTAGVVVDSRKLPSLAAFVVAAAQLVVKVQLVAASQFVVEAPKTTVLAMGAQPVEEVMDA